MVPEFLIMLDEIKRFNFKGDDTEVVPRNLLDQFGCLQRSRMEIQKQFNSVITQGGLNYLPKWIFFWGITDQLSIFETESSYKKKAHKVSSKKSSEMTSQLLQKSTPPPLTPPSTPPSLSPTTPLSPTTLPPTLPLSAIPSSPVPPLSPTQLPSPPTPSLNNDALIIA
eukprot:TRINITY_DN1220_c0_g1_i44.p3 TRINITY_DN1220_c0_g1~~TRINITY_DN1220_c0_g1_i44.p3  ORF type:complete len:168 (-),score=39.38 TRINITY_DN1220_c0_g1_i44:1786-2289(-)